MNPMPLPSRTETASKFVARHNEAASLVVGFLLGVIATLLGVVVG